MRARIKSAVKRPVRAAARRKRARRPDHEAAVEKRIAAGEDPESFLCIDCYCWSVEPLFCGCWARAAFPE